MCGIVGRVATNVTTAELVASVRTATESLIHRGPDASGLWVDEEAAIALGHRRLSIIDLSEGGAQPMVSSCGRRVIVYNGEVYNFPELRKELKSRGIRFRGDSDTEVLLEGIGAWGLEGTLQRCNGMFAFAVWDRSSRTLTLARDRLGQKPLYYGQTCSGFVFGSELRSLMGFGEVTIGIDRDAVADLLRYGYVPAPLSIRRGIRKLEPGHRLTFTPESGELELHRYWSIEEVASRGISNPFSGTFDEAVEQLDDLLRDAVRQSMVSDVALGAFLSGGIDSSAVTALMQGQGQDSVRTFSIGFGFESYDESAHARAVAKHLGTVHTELVVSAEAAQSVIPALPLIWDEPFGDSSQIPTVLVARMAREHVTVALSGDGGDEVFGGYDRYGWFEWLRRLGRVPRVARSVLALTGELAAKAPLDPTVGWVLGKLRRGKGPAALSHRAGRLASILRSADDESKVWASLTEMWTDAGVPALGSPPAVRPLGGIGQDSIRRAMYHDMRTYLPGDILTKVDRAAMSTGLETRIPILDHRVVEFAATLPTRYLRKNRDGKRVLREVLFRRCPKELFDRPKRGFAVPVREWLRTDLRDWAEAQLDPHRLEQEGYLRAAPIRRVWHEHLSGERNWQHQLWPVLMFQAWMEETGKSAATAPPARRSLHPTEPAT